MTCLAYRADVLDKTNTFVNYRSNTAPGDKTWALLLPFIKLFGLRLGVFAPTEVGHMKMDAVTNGVLPFMFAEFAGQQVSKDVDSKQTFHIDGGCT